VEAYLLEPATIRGPLPGVIVIHSPGLHDDGPNAIPYTGDRLGKVEGHIAELSKCRVILREWAPNGHRAHCEAGSALVGDRRIRLGAA
jgi:hypothetical protein